MKIKNDFIDIKTKNKTYRLNNLILDTYLNELIEFDSENLINNDKSMTHCMILLDNKLEFDETSKLEELDFDIELLLVKNYSLNFNENGVTANYAFASTEGYQLNDKERRKITAIAFFNKNQYAKAIVDVSNYNIYIEKNEYLEIIRQDTISSDANFYSSSPKIKAPIHLSPNGGDKLINVSSDSYPEEYFRTYAKPYSIGFGATKYAIQGEEILGLTINIEKTGVGKLKISTISNADSVIPIYPATNLYPAKSLYPSRKTSSKDAIYPSDSLYPSKDLYPARGLTQLLNLKYKIYQNTVDSNDNLVVTDTKEYYIQSVLCDVFGNLEETIKIERA